jgi:hypothetical protein
MFLNGFEKLTLIDLPLWAVDQLKKTYPKPILVGLNFNSSKPWILVENQSIN